jgi:hypothetical protein
LCGAPTGDDTDELTRKIATEPPNITSIEVGPIEVPVRHLLHVHPELFPRENGEAWYIA